MSNSESSSASVAGLLSSRRFLPLFITQFFTALNDNFYKNALIALITYGFAAERLGKGLREQAVMFAGVLFVLPYFLFSASAGKIADRIEKTVIVRWIKALEIVMMSVGAFAFFNDIFSLLFATVFFMGVHSTFFSPIKYGILPDYLRSNELVLGNALIEGATFAAIVLGTALGTQLVLIPQVGNHYTAAVLIAAAVIGYIACREMPPSPPMHAGMSIRFTPWADTVAMLRELPKYPQPMRYIWANTWFWFVSIMMMSIFPLYVSDVLRMNQDVYTLLLTLFALGVGIGSLVCAAGLRGKLSAKYTPAAALGMAVCTAGIAYHDVPLHIGEGIGTLADFMHAPSALFICGFMTLTAFFGGVYAVPFFAMLQHSAPEGKKAFMFGANNIVNAAGMTAAVVAVAVAQKCGVSIGHIFYAIALLCLLGAGVLHRMIPDSAFAWGRS